MPFDVAFSLSPDERMAFVIALGTLDGHQFDWEAHGWEHLVAYRDAMGL